MIYTAQKLKFSIKEFFSKCDHTHRKQRTWSHLQKESLIHEMSIDLLCKAVDWFLYEGNTGI